MTQASDATSRLRWGIIGAGRIARAALAPAIKKEGTLLAVASRDEDRARQVAGEMGAQRSYGSYEALLQDPDIDAVYLGLPNGLHEEWTIAAAQAKKHVLSDKSLTLSVESAKKMQQTCTENGVLMMEGFMYRHHPQWRQVFEWINADRIGQIRAIQATFVATLGDMNDHRWTPDLGKGCLFDITCYPINATRYITGEEPVAVSAYADWHCKKVDRSTQVSLLFPSGIMATAIGSFVSHGRQQLAIYGSKGWIIVERPWGPGQAPAPVSLSTADGIESIDVPATDQFAEMVRHFSECVKDGCPLSSPAENGLLNVTVCQAAALSAEEGRTVRL